MCGAQARVAPHIAEYTKGHKIFTPARTTVAAACLYCAEYTGGCKMRSCFAEMFTVYRSRVSADMRVCVERKVIGRECGGADQSGK